MQKLWSGIRTISNVGKCKNITSILTKSKSVDYPKNIANIFNNFFANVGDTKERKFPGEVIVPHSILGVSIQDQVVQSLSLRVKSGFLLVK